MDLNIGDGSPHYITHVDFLQIGQMTLSGHTNLRVLYYDSNKFNHGFTKAITNHFG